MLIDNDGRPLCHDPAAPRFYFRVFCAACPRGAQVTRTHIDEKDIARAFTAAGVVDLVLKKIEEAVVAFRVAHPPPKDAALRVKRGI